MKKNEQILLIDGSSLLRRVFHICLTSIGENIKESFLVTLNSYTKIFNTNRIYVAWDRKMDTSRLHYRFEATDGEYKAGRDHQHDVVLDKLGIELYPIIDSLGIVQIFPNVMEADDIIAWLVKKKLYSDKKIIISGDHDLIQLIDINTQYYEARKKELVNLDNYKDYTEGVDIDKFVIFKAIRGDSSDNIRGIRGYGKVKGAKVANSGDYSVFNLEQKALLEKNIRLMDLSKSFEIEPGEIEMYEEQFVTPEEKEFNSDRFQKYCEKYGFSKILNVISFWEDRYGESANDRLKNFFNAPKKNLFI